MERLNIASLADARPRLHRELEWLRVTELWKLNDIPTGPDAMETGEKTWILLAKGATHDYIIPSMAGAENTPDKYTVWIHNTGALDADRQQEQELPKGYVCIDKRKLGRKRRELTDEERQQIHARHEAGEGICRIAKALHLGTRRVMDALKD